MHRGALMRHPLSTSGGRSCVVPVADVSGFVVSDVMGKAVPEQFEPAVGQRPQGAVMGFAFGDLGVVELACPSGGMQAAKCPLMHGGTEIAVVCQPPGDNQFTAARSSGDRRGAGIALQRVGGVELLDVIA